ncbi:hypothetical protein LWF15_25355 [Kineosporia rhizophila]|uniref:hypothetical protein n=1 Tax=Kineosporia TaxID=49184 RepID=UPI001E598C36|nr:MULTISPECIES: hypothetical protein [Kineosporia]MCE0538831.1 hypothetical protein [Kineosporia rhizophila]GLY18749.1 hypothetical protein Kisp01_57630 [Kineosporia sp. NBRC 101677]
MSALDRLKQRSADDTVAGGGDRIETLAAHSVETPVELGGGDLHATDEDRSEEESLRARLGEDPNDVVAFDRLAEIVRAMGAESHEGGDPQRAAQDSVWALAEEVAQNNRAWYPLIQLARLSIDDDREMALRRLSTAADRDHTGDALAQGLQMLREAGHANDALNLGVGHWRPKEHVLPAGRELVLAAIEAERLSEARRHLAALAEHPDQNAVQALRQEIGDRLGPPTGSIPMGGANGISTMF